MRDMRAVHGRIVELFGTDCLIFIIFLSPSVQHLQSRFTLYTEVPYCSRYVSFKVIVYANDGYHKMCVMLAKYARSGFFVCCFFSTLPRS